MSISACVQHMYSVVDCTVHVTFHCVRGVVIIGEVTTEGVVEIGGGRIIAMTTITIDRMEGEGETIIESYIHS